VIALARRAAVLAVAALSLAACDKIGFPGKSPFQGVDVTGSPMGGELKLTDADGKPRSLADFKGKIVVVSFGFTHCPDVCPTTLADLAAARKQLGPDGQQVQVLFVTVDPKRDTGELLKQYVPAFDPTFIGLRGDEEATERVKKDFHVFAEERAGKPGEAYSVDHSAQIYVIDKAGRMRLLWQPGVAPSVMVADLRLLLNS
jgi:protein SCO1/2